MMNRYKLQDFGLYIDEEVAAYYHLAYDKKKKTLPVAITNMTTLFFKTQARRGALPQNYSVVADIDGLDCFKGNSCGSFTGTIETLLPNRTSAPLKLSQKDKWLFYVPADKRPSLFKAAYTPEKLLQEFQDKLCFLELPDDFDWWAHLVCITGTYLKF